MKKISCLIIALALIMSICPVFAYSDISENDNFHDAAYRLSDLKILSGYEDGTFRPYDSVTRAQVAKMIVCIMGKEDAAKSRGYSSRFSDVSDGHWAVPYINYATGSGILKGYADGTFGADRNVTYAELSAIMLRMLKYNEDDLGYNWPTNYTSKANSLGWNQGKYIGDNEALNRSLTVMLIDDALFCDLNKSAEGVTENKSLLSIYENEVIEDVLLVATPSDDKSLASNEISILSEDKSDKSDIYKVDTTNKNYSSGEVFSHVVIDPDTDRVIALRRYKDGESGQKEAMFATINRVVGDKIEYIGENGVKGTLTLDSGFVTYVDFSKSTYAMTKNEFTQGTDITLYGDEYGNWDFVVINNNVTTEPVLARKNYSATDTNMEGITINHDNLTVYRGGKTATLSDIRANDVVYYNKKTNIMDVYTKKVTGIYYDAKPNKAYVTQVTVGGKDYTIGTIEATNMLDASSGAYEIGDRLTLLLGKNDEVVFVNNISGFNQMEYGVLLSGSTGIKQTGETSGTSEYIAKMFMPNGEIYEYATDKNYNSYKGKLMKINEASNGTMKLTAQGGISNFSGDIDIKNGTIAGKNVSSDTVIVQRINNSKGEITSCELLNFDTLNVKSISSGHVLNVIYDSFGDIGILYVDGLTDTDCSYGILSSKKVNAQGEMASITYSVYSDGVLNTYTTSYNSTVSQGPVMFKTENGMLAEIKSLTLYKSASAYTAIDETRVNISGEIYDIDPNVKVFCNTKTNVYEEKSFTDLKEASISNISIYSNTAKKNNGVVKVIVYK